MTDRCKTCDRTECPWIKFDGMDWWEFDEYEPDVTSAARDNCKCNAVNWRERAMRAERNLIATVAELVACEKERDAMRDIVEQADLWLTERPGGVERDTEARLINAILDYRKEAK